MNITAVYYENHMKDTTPCEHNAQSSVIQLAVDVLTAVI